MQSSTMLTLSDQTKMLGKVPLSLVSQVPLSLVSQTSPTDQAAGVP